MKTSGMGVLDKAPLIQDEDHRQHYDFCGELGIKKIYQQAFASYQPEFQLFRARVVKRYTIAGEASRKVTWSEPKNTPEGEVSLKIPTDVFLTRFGRAEAEEIKDSWADDAAMMMMLRLKQIIDISGASYRDLGKMLLDANVVLTIGPKEMNPSESSFFYRYYDKEEVLFTKSPNDAEWFRKQPHLQDHTTFQFYLFGEETMSANWRFLGIKEKDGKFVLPYKLFINYAPGQLHYRWEFKYITVKCNINNQGNFEDWTNPARIMRGFDFKIGGKVLASGASFGFGTNWDDPGEKAGKEKKKKDNSPPNPKKTPQPFYDKIVDPAMSSFDSKTVDYHYSLGEFFNRLTTPIFFFRINYSQLFHNRLVWANNKNNLAVSNLPIQWKNLSSYTQGSQDRKKLGYWRWREAVLESDNNNFFTNLMRKGYWLTDGKELTNPNFTEQKGHDFIEIGGNAWDITVAEEHWKETIVKTEEDNIIAEVDREKGANYHQRSHYFIFYEDGTTDHWIALYPKNDAVSGGFNKALRDGHTHKAFILEFDKPVKKMVDIYTCIGCGAQGTPLFDTLHSNYRNKNSDSWDTIHKGLPFEPWYSAMCSATAPTYNLTVNGVMGRLGTKGDVWEKATIEKVGTLFTKAYGFIPNGGTIQWRLSGNYKIVRESYFVEKKTQTQEIDQEMLEQEYEEEEIIEEEILEENDLEQETGAGGMGAGLEKEREFEEENEQEEEDEEEQEEENEREDESEQEQEDEQESEKEEESEDEGEGEDEDEVEEL